MFQETVVAEGTDSMYNDQSNDAIAALAQQDLYITNLNEACTSTSTSSSGGTKRSRRSRRSRSRRSRRRRRSRINIISRRNRRRRSRRNKRRRNKTKKMRGGVKEPVLMPPIFTEMKKYIEQIN